MFFHQARTMHGLVTRFNIVLFYEKISCFMNYYVAQTETCGAKLYQSRSHTALLSEVGQSNIPYRLLQAANNN